MPLPSGLGQSCIKENFPVIFFQISLKATFSLNNHTIIFNIEKKAVAKSEYFTFATATKFKNK